MLLLGIRCTSSFSDFTRKDNGWERASQTRSLYARPAASSKTQTWATATSAPQHRSSSENLLTHLGRGRPSQGRCRCQDCTNGPPSQPARLQLPAWKGKRGRERAESGSGVKNPQQIAMNIRDIQAKCSTRGQHSLLFLEPRLRQWESCTASLHKATAIANPTTQTTGLLRRGEPDAQLTVRTLGANDRLAGAAWVGKVAKAKAKGKGIQAAPPLGRPPLAFSTDQLFALSGALCFGETSPSPGGGGAHESRHWLSARSNTF